MDESDKKQRRKEYLKQWVKDNPEKRRAIQKRSNDKYREANKEKRRIKLYALNQEEFERLKTSQDNLCAICGSPPTRPELDIDHCHVTGRVRGLLCNNCNRGIGHLKDDITLLENAISYLKNFQLKE